MGMIRRLFKGAEEGPDQDDSARRSPEGTAPAADAADSTRELTAELRTLIQEIRLLKEEIAASRSSGSPEGSSRSGRGGRRGRDRDRERDRARDPGEGGRAARRGLPKTPPEDAPTGPLVDYLRERGVIVFEGSDDLARNEAFEHLARHIGQHFHLVANFYEKLKRCVATGHQQRIDIENYGDKERSAAIQLGTLLHRHGMLKDFYYHRSPKKQLRVIPTQDGEVAQFLTGGWLENYVSWLLSRRLKARLSPARFQVLFNVKGTLPDGREFEADLMAWVDGRLLWIECKTGNWQDYAARFRGLVKIFGVERDSAALLLLRAPDAATRKRASDMMDMTLIALDEVEAFVNRFLGVPAAEAGSSRRPRQEEEEDRTAPLPPGVIPPLSEDEIPLENAEPARKLGRVQLGGSEEEEKSGRRRRRRGRRGGRGRKREGEAPASEAEAREKRLLEPLPIQPVAPGGEKPGEEPAADEAAREEPAARGTGRAGTRRKKETAAEAGSTTREEAREEAPEKEERKRASAGESRRSAARRRRVVPRSPFAVEEDPAGTAKESAETPAETAAEAAREPAAAEQDPLPAQGDAGEKPAVRRSRRRRRSAETGEAAAAGEPEDAPARRPRRRRASTSGEKAGKEKPAAAAEEAKAEEPSRPAPEPKAEDAPKPGGGKPPESKTGEAPQSEAGGEDAGNTGDTGAASKGLPVVPRKGEVTGATIAPDLSSMVARPPEEED